MDSAYVWFGLASDGNSGIDERVSSKRRQNHLSFYIIGKNFTFLIELGIVMRAFKISHRVQVALLLLMMAGCAANPLNPQAQKVRLVTSDPKDCEYLGEVTGNQGNFFTGGWTSNANLETGARNDLKNQAAQMGGNTIQLLTTRAGQTGSLGVANGSGGGSSEQTNVTYVGAVYRCR